MKFQWIGTGARLTRTVLLSCLLLAAANAQAMDDDLPAPEAAPAAPPSSVGPDKKAENSVLREDESIPAPSIGDEALPEPSVDRGQEKASNQVNKAPNDDEIFLPTPNMGDNVYYAPVGTPAPRVTADDVDFRNAGRDRPMFSLYLGAGAKSYDNTLVSNVYSPGLMVGLGWRFLSLGEFLFLHGTVRYSRYNLGAVGSLPAVLDQTLEYGGMLEMGLGRHFSLFGSLLRRNSWMESGNNSAAAGASLSDGANIALPPNWYLGLGAQWDFWIVPHGSMGLHAEAAQNLYSLTLVISAEPAPRQKLNLDYNSMND